MVKTLPPEDGPWVFSGTNNRKMILRFRPSTFKKQRDEFRDGARRVSCALNGLPVYDETTQVRLGHYSCSRYGNKKCHRAGEIAGLRKRFGGCPSRMKTHRQGKGFHDCVVCARCSIRVSSDPTAFDRRRDKREEDLLLDGEVLVVGNEGSLPSEIGNANQPRRRSLTFVRSIRFSDAVFRNAFPAIAPDLMEHVLSKDETGLPLLHRKFAAFWHEMSVLCDQGFIPPAKTWQRAITYVCKKVAWDHVVTTYPNVVPTKQIRMSVPIKRALCRLARELRLVYGSASE